MRCHQRCVWAVPDWLGTASADVGGFGAAVDVALGEAALSAIAAYWTAATTLNSRSAGGSAAGAAWVRLLATGVNSATSTWHWWQLLGAP